MKDLKKLPVDLRLAMITGYITEARKACFLSQARAAKALGLQRPSLSLIERGKQRLTVELLLKMAELYRLWPHQLLCSYAMGEAFSRDQMKVVENAYRNRDVLMSAVELVETYERDSF